MSKMRKLLAMVLTLAMVLGMSMTTFAAEPKGTDSKPVTVSNVENGAELKAYQLIDAKYGVGDKGFVKYVWAFNYTYTNANNETVNIVKDSDVVFDENGNIPLLTSELVTKLAANTSILTKAPTDVTATSTTASMDLTVGTWMILVTPSSEKDIKVYNPMIASVYYELAGSGDDANATAPGVDAGSMWTLVTTNAYVKSSGVTLTKEAATTWNLGDMVEYKVTATVPDYSDAYVAADIKYEIVDTAVTSELEIQNTQENPINVSVPEGNYTLEATQDGYTLTVDGDWIINNANATITITYKAKLVGEIYANDATEADMKAHDNTVVLTYTNSLDRVDNEYTVDTVTAYESVYTFKVENIITKTGADNNNDGKADPLAGAIFGIYKDDDCEKGTEYKNTMHPDGTVTSKISAEGEPAYVNLYGLDLGTYYLKEIEAPKGYSLNDSVYTVVISANVNDNANISDTVENIVITVNGGESVVIPNTKLASLPSTGGIGTTIFTIAGCGIMIAAAYLFFASRRKEEA